MALARGRYPERRPDSSERSQDQIEAALAGKPLGFKGALLFCKSDLMETVTTMAFPSWSANEHCCNSCCCCREDRFDIAGLNPLGVPWPSKTVDLYSAACAACEVLVEVTDDNFPELRGSMSFDTREHGNRGRCLQRDIPALHLLKGDRLEPSPELVNTMDFDRKQRPFICRFWRRSAETVARHRNPLVDSHPCIEPKDLVTDWLHCLSLGVFQYFLNFVFYWITDHGLLENSLEAVVLRVRAMIFDWYGSEHRAGRVRHRLQDLQTSMIGVRGGAISLHGAETNDMLVFVVDVILPLCTEGPDFDLVRGAGTSLRDMLLVIRVHGDNWGPRAAQELVDCYLRFLGMYSALKAPMKPKHHQACHLVASTLFHGSPQLSGCWQDEAINRHLKLCALKSHRLVWYKRILIDFSVGFGVGRSQRKKLRC